MKSSKRHFTHKDTGSKGVQTISRAIGVLNEVAKNNDQGAALSTIARSVNLNISTTHRILSALKSEGFIEHNPISKLYHLGIALYHLGASAHQFSVCKHFKSTLETIASHTEDTTFLLIHSVYDAVCIDRVEGKFPIRTLTFDVGSRRPLGIGAGGLALIAFLPDEEVQEIINSNKKRYPLFNNRSPNDIRALVLQTQKLGYALSKGNVTPNATAVALPVYDDNGSAIAAISVAAIDQRMDKKRIDKIARIIKSELEIHPSYRIKKEYMPKGIKKLSK
jgi:DNA-binding IclR family transcriptional regulator